jgi:hypothetical protein
MAEQWAVCISPDKLVDAKEPRFFKTRADAERFLRSKARWPKERLAAHREAVRKLKAQEIHPLNFPQQLVRKRQHQAGWEGPVPVVGITAGPGPAQSFQDFFPLDKLGSIPDESLEELIHRVFENDSPTFACFLNDEWRFDEIAKDCRHRGGHEFAGVKYESIAAIVLGAIYDFGPSLARFHSALSMKSVAHFYRSWQLWNHLAEFCNRLGASATGRSLAGDILKAQKECSASLDFFYVRLSIYAHEIEPLIPKTPAIYPSEISSAQRLLQKAEEQARMQIEYEKALARLRDSTEEVESVEQLAAESGQSNEDCTRSADVDVFLKRCNKLSDATIYKRHIWQSVGHAKGRQFEYWQECNEAKATNADRRNFSRILREGPEQFLATLKRKRLVE